MKKNTLIIVLLVVALFIPTYIAIANYFYMNGTPVTINDADKIEIKDHVSGMVYTEKAGSVIVEFIDKLDKNASPIGSLPTGLAGQNNFSVIAYDGKRATASEYYIIKDNAIGYRVDSKGTAYELNDELVAEFLNTKYAQGLYEEAALPTLLNGTNEILPKAYTWSYTPMSGSGRVDASLTKLAEETVTYTSKNGLSLNFSREPDTFDVVVKSAADQTELYSGSYAALSGINTKVTPTLEVNVTTVWNESETLPAGSATYSFILDIEAQPEFILTYSGAEDDSFVLGDIAMLKAETVKDPENISITITPKLTHNDKEIKPVFYTNGSDSLALIPTSYDTKAGNYTIEIVYAGVTEKLTLSIGDKTFKNAGTHPASAEKISSSYSASVLEAYDAEVAKILSEASTTEKYFTSAPFVAANASYTGDGGLFGYGRTKTLKDGSGVYTNMGLDYTMSKGHKIQAIMDGKVLFVGYTEFSGDMVVIDHGYGIVSFYHNLDKNTIKVAKGDTVKQGTILCDQVSDSGFTNGNTLHQRLLIGGVPVCEYDLWDVGIEF